MKNTNTKEIKAITELALDTLVVTKDTQFPCSVGTIVKLGAYIEVLAILRNTTEDHERNRLERLYNLRNNRGTL